MANDTAFSLASALELTHEYLASFAASDTFTEDLTTAFGSAFDTTTAATFQQQWLAGDFSTFLTIEVISSAQINGAYGAYAQATNQIYLSAEFLNA
ncbi:MAG: hypothetical protein WA902_10950, partial [Thermosynechococcaceae cyanobacterium]